MSDEVEVGPARFVNGNIFAEKRHVLCVVVVSGPDDDGDICLRAGAESYLLPRDTARRLYHELAKRLRAKTTKGPDAF